MSSRNVPQINSISETTSNTVTYTKFGGVSILIKKDIPHYQINIDTEFQVITVKATLHKPKKICSIYVTPHDPINKTKLSWLIKQIPKPNILVGDLKTIKKGKDLEKVINNNLCTLNYKSQTYLEPSTDPI